MVVPVLWVMTAAFRTQISLLTGAFWFTPVLKSFVDLLFTKTSEFLVNYRNSLIVGIASTVICLVTATLAAWSLNRMHWPKWVIHIFLGWAMLFHMFPALALASAWYTMMRPIGLDNTLTGVVLAHAVLNLPMALWLMVRVCPRRPGRARSGRPDRRRLDADGAVAGGGPHHHARPRRNRHPDLRLQLERVRGRARR